MSSQQFAHTDHGRVRSSENKKTNSTTDSTSRPRSDKSVSQPSCRPTVPKAISHRSQQSHQTLPMSNVISQQYKDLKNTKNEQALSTVPNESFKCPSSDGN